MRRTVFLAAVCLLLSHLAAGQQNRLQIISLNKDARTFVSTGNEWKQAMVDTPIDTTTIFKNYSNPPSRIIVRDWKRNVLYDITLPQIEVCMAEVVRTEVDDKEGKMGAFVVRQIGETRIPALHYSRATPAATQRGETDTSIWPRHFKPSAVTL